MAAYSSILAWRIPWTEEPGDFGTWKKECVTYNFWDAKSPVKCSRDDLKHVTYRLGNEILTFVGGFADEDCVATIDYGAAVASAKNDESGSALEVTGTKVKFPLKKHDFIFINATLK